MKQKMDILIDSQKAITVEVELVESEGDKYHVLDITNTYDLLQAWMEIDEKRRAFRWTDEGEGVPVTIAWWSDSSGLVLDQASAFWDGKFDWDAHSLEALELCLPSGTLEYESLIAGESNG